MSDKNPNHSFIFKKTEAVISAVYLLSGLLTDNEPLKWRLRAVGADVLESAESFLFGRDAARSGGELQKEIEQGGRLLGSYCGVLARGRSLSMRNVEVVCREIELVVQLIRDMSPSAEREAAEQITAALSITAPQAALLAASRQSGRRLGNVLREIRPRDVRARGAMVSEGHAHPGNPPLVSRGVGVGARSLDGTQERDSATVRDVSAVRRPSEEAEGRRSVILDIIRTRGSVTVKDVSRLLPGYSGKTVQRELIALVSAGLLRREGARRWSRYSMNQSVHERSTLTSDVLTTKSPDQH